MQRPDTAAEVQRGEALARLAVVASAAELQAAADRQAELAAAGMEGVFAHRHHQVHRLQVRRSSHFQRQLQRQATEVRGLAGDAQAPGLFVEAQLQAGMLEGMAGLRLVGQLAAEAEEADLRVRYRLAAVQVEEIGGAVGQVVEVGDGQREHPAGADDAPVVPALAPAEVAGDVAEHPRPGGPADRPGIEPAVAVAEVAQGRGRYGEGIGGGSVHLTHPCDRLTQACRLRKEGGKYPLQN